MVRGHPARRVTPHHARSGCQSSSFPHTMVSLSRSVRSKEKGQLEARYGMGKASRRKREHKRSGQSSITTSPWVTSVWAKRSAELLEHLAIPHPALVSVMVTAALRY